MKWVIVALLAVVAAAISPWAIGIAYMHLAGQVVEGKVIGKHEAILLPGGDSWDHVFEITYSYRPVDSSYPETAKHRVDSHLYRRTKIGSAVRVRYSPLRMLWPVVGLGSFLDESSLLSRLGLELFTTRHIAAVATILVGLSIALFAYRRKSVRLGIIAAWITLIPAPAPFLAITAFVVFPMLFWSWQHNKRGVYGWLFLGSIPFCAAVVDWNIPQPTQLPANSPQSTAIVRQMRVVNEIWTNYGKGAEDAGGQGIRQPFQMVDLEFRPDGASDSMHVLDRVDLNSVAGLREGGTAQIAYSSTDPDIARIAGGTRHYPRLNLLYLLGLTYGIGGTLAVLVLPGIVLADRFLHSLGKALPFRTPEDSIQLLSRFPIGDPRRAAIEKVMQALQRRQRKATTSSTKDMNREMHGLN
jgi:hypothetical protein